MYKLDYHPYKWEYLEYKWLQTPFERSSHIWSKGNGFNNFHLVKFYHDNLIVNI